VRFLGVDEEDYYDETTGTGSDNTGNQNSGNESSGNGGRKRKKPGFNFTNIL
jgi:hypothetical protein